MSDFNFDLCDATLIGTFHPHPVVAAIEELLAAIKWQIDRESQSAPREFTPIISWRGQNLTLNRLVVINGEIYTQTPKELIVRPCLTDNFSGEAQYELVIDNAASFVEASLSSKPDGGASLFWARPPHIVRQLTDQGLCLDVCGHLAWV